ncbi:unnamed protein product [Fraxinus pennsylvanica]|uniref:Late embryogenesis abundant protein LEA-2 subgroup domain-containing protein n=1 Tax=Fraxinus pennsylvanica TaxID=56036 RepID=A0AAD1YXV7_9LAMI|nr:unnamed protein product [Fraxinus pennsylvanica]
MAEHQRIHPVQDPEAATPQTPTAPLVPRGSSRSDKGNPIPTEQYPPFHRTIPYAPSKPPPRRSCCRKCLCWTISLLLLQILILGILAAIIYFVFQPKIPKYSVDAMRITQFDFGNDNSLSAAFNVNITARNPNKKIGIYYEGGSHLSTRNANGLLESLQEQQQTGNIPLRLRAKVPVRLKLGKLKLMKWKFLVRCRLVVDTLSADNAIRIRESNCKFRFRL